MCNGKNKTELIKLIASSFQRNDIQVLFDIPFFFTTENENYLLKENVIIELENSVKLILEMILKWRLVQQLQEEEMLLDTETQFLNRLI